MDHKKVVNFEPIDNQGWNCQNQKLIIKGFKRKKYISLFQNLHSWNITLFSKRVRLILHMSADKISFIVNDDCGDLAEIPSNPTYRSINRGKEKAPKKFDTKFRWTPGKCLLKEVLIEMPYEARKYSREQKLSGTQKLALCP